jgi:hypothetical protein
MTGSASQHRPAAVGSPREVAVLIDDGSRRSARIESIVGGRGLRSRSRCRGAGDRAVLSYLSLENG